MTGQDILEKMKEDPYNEWITTEKLTEWGFKHNVMKKMRSLSKFGFINLKYDRRYYFRVKKE